uniref:SFRICE_026784 n=1 Tax=Spodoptera frugiperda TaxID=7108 RepID=A0A2H1VJ43_SPOFR
MYIKTFLTASLAEWLQVRLGKGSRLRFPGRAKDHWAFFGFFKNLSVVARILEICLALVHRKELARKRHDKNLEQLIKWSNKMGMQRERIKNFPRLMFITHSKPGTH